MGGNIGSAHCGRHKHAKRLLDSEEQQGFDVAPLQGLPFQCLASKRGLVNRACTLSTLALSEKIDTREKCSDLVATRGLHKSLLLTSRLRVCEEGPSVVAKLPRGQSPYLHVRLWLRWLRDSLMWLMFAQADD